MTRRIWTFGPRLASLQKVKRADRREMDGWSQALDRMKTTRRIFLKTAGTAALAGLTGAACTDGETGSSGEAAGGPARTSAPPTPQVGDLLAVPEALFRPTASGCTVQWVPRGNVEARILVGSEPGDLAEAGVVSSAETAEFAVDGFPADAELSLQCQFRRAGEDDWISRPVRRVRTARAPGRSFQVALLADSHVYFASRNAQHMQNLERTIARVVADEPDFVIFLGDEAGIQTHFDPIAYMTQERAFERWSYWRTALAPLLAALPSFLVLGNHEGEAGYFQSLRLDARTLHYQRWGTIARKRYCLNPLPTTYAEGGENDGWSGDAASPATGGASEGNCSPLHNYYAWTWGDALFVVLDVHRYTNVGGSAPTSVEQWTLGETQLRWMERVLLESGARWKVVVAHHVVGGYAWNALGSSRDTKYVYGRGGARYARVGEQARITDVMKRAGARFFLYGHDHVFAHQQAEGLHFVCCGRPTFLQPDWWTTPGWQEAYGNAAAQNPRDFHAAIGYTRLTITPAECRVEYIRTGTDANGAENVSQPEGETVYDFSVHA